MRRIKDILEQHAEKGRFKPTVPRYVSSTAGASPRPASDSANVKLKEDGGPSQNTLLVKKKKPMSTATAEISFQSVKEVAEVGDDPTNQGTPEGLVKRGNKTVLKKFKELTELVSPEAKDDIKSLDSMSFLKKHGLTKTRVKERLANEEIERVDEMDKSQTPPGRDGGEQFAPGPKVSKKTIKAVQKDPAKHLSDLFAKQYAKKKMKEEVEQIDENSDPKAEEAYKHYKKHVLPIHKKHGLSPEFAKAVNHHVAKYGSYQVWNHHGDAEGRDPHWFDSEKQKVKSIKQKRGYEVSEEVEQIEEGRPSQRHPLEGHEYHKKTDAELVYIAKDAHKAAEAMKGHNTTAENKYRDQANDSATVRYFRQKSGMPDWYKKKYGHMKEEVMVEISSNTLKSYQQKVSNDAMKHKMDPTKRSPEKANRSISGFSKAQKRLEKGVAEGAPDLLKKEMPLHRHAEKMVAQNGVSKNDPDYHHHLGNTIKHLRMFGNIDLINKQDVKEEVMVEGGHDNAGGHYYDIKNSDGTIGMGYKPGKHYPSSSSKIEIKSEPKHPLHGKQVTNGKVTGKLIGTEHQGRAAKIKHSSGMIHHVDAKEIRKADMKEEAKDPKEYGYEGDMAMNQLQTIMRHAEYLMDMMKPDTDLPEWVQSKITLAADYIQTSCDYMTSEMKEETMSEEIKKGDYVKDTVHGHVHHVFDVRDNNLIVGRYHGRNSYGGTTNLHMSKAKKVEKPMGEATEPPFAGPYKKETGTVKDKSGAKHTPMSKAKDLAKKAAMRQAGMKKESIQESRRADIIREAMKAAKEKVKKEKSTADEDKFIADPELNSKVIKTASQM